MKLANILGACSALVLSSPLSAADVHNSQEIVIPGLEQRAIAVSGTRAADKTKGVDGREAFAFEDVPWSLPCKQRSDSRYPSYRLTPVYSAPWGPDHKGHILYEHFAFLSNDCSGTPRHVSQVYYGEQYTREAGANGSVIVHTTKGETHVIALSDGQLVRRIDRKAAERLPGAGYDWIKFRK